jgi:F-type H+-transporting ATPase subunit alpha
MEARGTGRAVDAPVGEGLLGRVIDATGRVLDGGGPLRVADRWPAERPAPAIIDRAPVTRPLLTGLKVVDALIPIGRGQRELIVGDRQIGKTTIAVDAILSQRNEQTICVYCAIGQRGTAVARVVETLRQRGAIAYSVVVVAGGEDAPGLQFITPYAATTMAEYFVEAGRDVLIVYDDLTRHARAYRELSLMLRRPPGREAYPGDIFYIHSRLLERSAQLSEERGGGSLTALPIVETQAQDIAAYIPTNLVSITDGQIYLSPDLYRKSVMPAVDVGKSVSRVGGKAQLPAYRAVAGDLRLAYSQFEELETFARFATRLDDDTRAAIERGRRVRAVLGQREHWLIGAAEQIAILHAVNNGLFDRRTIEEIPDGERAIQTAVRHLHPELCARIARGETLDNSDWNALLSAARDALADA